MSAPIKFPESLDGDSLVVPSGVDSAQLNEAFARLDDEIVALSRKVEAHRVYYSEKTDSPSSQNASRCTMVCKDLTGERKHKCLKRCTRPIVKLDTLEELEGEFPVDTTRLKDDMILRQNFERHQTAPETIEETDGEASLIADMYAMPVTTAAMPEESWARAMDIVKMERFAPQRDTLVKNWKYRAKSYSDEAREELARKINRHDSDDILIKTARKFR